MNSAILKYSSLNNTEKTEVENFIDFLLSKKNFKKKSSNKDYKKKILSVSVWNEKDVEIFNKNNKLFEQWKPEQW